MLSKEQIKHIKSLRIKKYRNLYREFIAEGDKIVAELYHRNKQDTKSPFKIKKIFACPEWIKQQSISSQNSDLKIYDLKSGELEKISSLKTPNQVLAIIHLPDHKINYNEVKNDLSIFLENIQDPGNLGNIIRISDWFGIKNIFCSPDSAEIYNPKVIQSSMGSFSRVKVHYIDINSLIDNLNYSIQIYGTFLEGENIYNTKLSETGIIIMGNESKGIHPNLEKLVTKKLSIPTFPGDEAEINSLNVSAATAIICSEFRRRIKRQHSYRQ
ncbi:RNA methyltransferase [Bacteroidota bacterium]